MTTKGKNEDPRCVHCGSTETRKHKWSGGFFAIPLLLIGIPLLVPSKKYHCFGCGLDFQTMRSRPHRSVDRKVVVAVIIGIILVIVLLL